MYKSFYLFVFTSTVWNSDLGSVDAEVSDKKPCFDGAFNVSSDTSLLIAFEGCF